MATAQQEVKRSTKVLEIEERLHQEASQFGEWKVKRANPYSPDERIFTVRLCFDERDPRESKDLTSKRVGRIALSVYFDGSGGEVDSFRSTTVINSTHEDRYSIHTIYADDPIEAVKSSFQGCVRDLSEVRENERNRIALSTARLKTLEKLEKMATEL